MSGVLARAPWKLSLRDAHAASKMASSSVVTPLPKSCRCLIHTYATKMHEHAMSSHGDGLTSGSTHAWFHCFPVLLGPSSLAASTTLLLRRGALFGGDGSVVLLFSTATIGGIASSEVV